MHLNESPASSRKRFQIWNGVSTGTLIWIKHRDPLGELIADAKRAGEGRTPYHLQDLEIQDANGVVFQKELGPRTDELAECMTSFNPDQSWAKVTDTEPLR